MAYQLFTRGLIPSMAKAETNKISTLLTWAREEDEIPWEWIVQEGREIERVSKPGRRVYASVKNLPRVNNGLGISVLSTPKGIMADHEAREANVGGEVLFTVF